MKNEMPYDLIANYLSGRCSAEESEQLVQWRKADKNNEVIYKQMKSAWKHTTPEQYEPNIEAALEKVSARLGKQKSIQPAFNRFWIGAAAALIVGLGIFSVVKFIGNKTSLQTIETFAESSLQNVVLPDGSQVSLSKNSKLSYPEKFKGNQRKISFVGEAYFIITPDKSKPFIIESGNTITRVLGTEFNLKACKSDSIIRLTVTKGLVSFNLEDGQTGNEVKVEAGEVGEANVTKGKVKKFINNDPNFLAWKTGILKFEDQQLSVAIKTISEYYKQPFYVSSELDTVVFSTTFDSLPIDQVIESMKLILDVDIALENGVYILHQKS